MGQANQIEDLQEKQYINALHGNSKGWITKAEINKTFKQWHYKHLELIQQDFKGDNLYISINTFCSTYRRLEYLKELKAQFIDLDIYNTKFTKDQVLMNLDENYFSKSIPRPNFIIDSGRGLYLIWLINAVPSKALPLWKAVEEYLYSVLKPLGADRQALDATRVLRVPGSTNSKSGSVVEILEEYDYIYDLREIQNNYLPELKPNKNKKGRPKKTVFIFRERSLYYSRIQDITKLCELRKYDLKGKREVILFLYRYYLCYFTDDVKKALEDVLELNRQFIQPLSEKEAIRATRSAETVYLKKEKQYKYKNETLIELLDISQEEQEHLKTIIGSREYKRRKRVRNNIAYDSLKAKEKYYNTLKESGKLTEKEQISQRRLKIKDLLAQGLLQKEICSLLNISKPTYIRDRRFLKEQGLI